MGHDPTYSVSISFIPSVGKVFKEDKVVLELVSGLNIFSFALATYNCFKVFIFSSSALYLFSRSINSSFETSVAASIAISGLFDV